MLARIATRVASVCAIVAAAGLAMVSVSRCRTPAPPPPRVRHAGCGGWVAESLEAPTMTDVLRLADDDVWLLAQRGLYHWDGCTWRVHQPFGELAGRTIHWRSISRDASGRLVLAGHQDHGPEIRQGCVSYYAFPAREMRFGFDGRRWIELEDGPAAPHEVGIAKDAFGKDHDVIVTSGDASDRWAIIEVRAVIPAPDAQGRMWYRTPTFRELWHARSGRWSLVLGPSSGATMVLPRPPTTKWIAASDGLSRWDGTHWQHVRDDLWFYGLGGSSPTDLWAVGHGMRDPKLEILHYDGHTWTSTVDRAPNKHFRLTAITSTGPDDAWAVGDHGAVLHWDGQRWLEAPAPTFGDLDAVRVTRNSVRVASGGAVFRLDR